MSKTWGPRQPLVLVQHDSGAQPPMKVTLPELRLEIAVERPVEGGGPLLVIRSITGEPIEIRPSTANTIGVRCTEEK